MFKKTNNQGLHELFSTVSLAQFATHEAWLRAVEGHHVSSESPLRVQEHDQGVAGRNEG